MSRKIWKCFIHIYSHGKWIEAKEETFIAVRNQIRNSDLSTKIMTPKLKTRNTNKSLYSNYLKHANECHAAAKESSKKTDWNAATICAIHACISACDAMCIYYLGKRHSGEDHNNSVKLFKTIKGNDENHDKNANRLSRIISIKNMAEYEERLVFKTEADRILKDMERFCNYVRRQLP